MNLSRFKIPHVFIFLFYIICFCALLSYMIPSGSFQREKKVINHVEQNVVIPGTYNTFPKTLSLKSTVLNQKVEGEASATSVLEVLTAIPKGLQQSAALIFFVFTIGAVFSLILESNAIHALVGWLIHKFRNNTTLLFFLVYAAFSFGSSFLGIINEVIPIIPVIVLLAREKGYDHMFGFGLVVLPAFIGWSTAATNPFNVQIAQQVAELPIGSGIGLRIGVFMVALFIGFAYLMRYGQRVRNKKQKAILESSNESQQEQSVFNEIVLTPRHKWILSIFVLGYAGILLSVQLLGWGLIEMSGGFLAIAIVVMMINGLSSDQSMEIFIKGLAIMIIPALAVGVARGVSVVMFESQIMDTILFHSANALSELPKTMATIGMLFFQSTLNFFIPSASGQALVSMPLMTPLADLLSIPRQVAVLAFVFGDGFTNIIIPTNGVLMAMLAISNVPFGKWFRFVLPIFLIMMLFAVLVLVFALFTGYGT